jgi:hypothetical protein
MRFFALKKAGKQPEMTSSRAKEKGAARLLSLKPA